MTNAANHRENIPQFYVGIVMLLLAAALPAQEAQSIVGRWRSVETSHGGIGALYEFRADDTFSFSPGAIVDIQKPKVEWNGQDAFHVDGIAYTRVGAAPDANHPLTGEWTGTFQMGGKKVERRFIFDRAGHCLMLVIFLTQNGIYTARGGNLVARIHGASGLNGTFSFANGVLTIHRTNGKITRLKKY